MSKIKCFSCHKTGHYASQCLYKKKGKEKNVESLEDDDEKFVEGF